MFDIGFIEDQPAQPSVSVQSMGERISTVQRETPSPRTPRYALKHQADAWKRAFSGGDLPRFKAWHGCGRARAVAQEVFQVKAERLRLSSKPRWVAASQVPVQKDRLVEAVIGLDMDLGSAKNRTSHRINSVITAFVDACQAREASQSATSFAVSTPLPSAPFTLGIRM